MALREYATNVGTSGEYSCFCRGSHQAIKFNLLLSKYIRTHVFSASFYFSRARMFGHSSRRISRARNIFNAVSSRDEILLSAIIFKINRTEPEIYWRKLTDTYILCENIFTSKRYILNKLTDERIFCANLQRIQGNISKVQRSL